MNPLVVLLPDAHATFDWLLRTSLHVALLVLVVLLVIMLAGRRLSPGCRHALWLLVAVRMALPVLPSSPWSVFNLFDTERAVAAGDSADVIVTEPETGWIITKDPLPGQPPQVIGHVVEADRLDWNWRHGLLLAWLIGVVAFLARVIIANVVFAVRIRRGTGVDDTGVLALLCACQRDMNVTTPVRIIATDAVRGPALWGTLRPAMLIPPAMLRELSREDLRFVFLHELAHLKRRDIIADWVLSLLHAFHWFNPAVWLALSRLRAERELSRDAMVLAATSPREERGYGQTILKLVQAISRPGVLRPGAVGILEEKTELKRRIAMIARFDRNGSARGRGLAVVLALLIACVLLTDKRVADAAAPIEGDPAQKLAEDPPAQPQPAGKPQFPPDWPDAKEVTKAEAVKDADAKAERQLARQLPEVRFENVPFTDAIDFLRDVSGANIFVNWRALEAARIDRNVAVTTRLKDVKLSRAIEHILQNVGGGQVELDFVVKEGVITISTTEDLDRDTEVRVYDVRDLIVVEEKDEKAAQKKRAEFVESITDLVQATVHPDSWVNRGGKVGSIRYLSGQLIVTHTPRHHAQIERLFDQLREARAVHVSLEIRFITTTTDTVKAHELEPREGKRAVLLDVEAMNAFIRAVQPDRDSTVLTAPRVTLVNGQKGNVKVAQQQAYVADIKEVAGEFRPQVASHDSGVDLGVTATVTRDRKSVVLDVHPRVTQLIEMKESRWPKAPPGRDDLKVQTPREVVAEDRALLTVPDEGVLAMTLDAPLHAKDAGQRRVVMLVKPKVIVQREVEQRAVPLPNARGEAKQ